jgi:aspartyl protease family protein
MTEKHPNPKIVDLAKYRKRANAAKRMEEKHPNPDKVVDITTYQVRTNTVIKKPYKHKMFIFLFLFVLVAILVSLPENKPSSTEDANTCKSKINEDGNIEVTIDQDTSGHYVCLGYINGEKVMFILDTGATFVTIPEKYTHYLGLQTGKAFYAETANGKSLSYPTFIKNIKVGDISINGIEGTISTGMDIDAVLLGMSFLRQVDFSFSRKENKMKLIR